MVLASNLGQYLPIVLMMGLATVFAAGSFLASGLLAPRSPNDRKRAPYECGIIPAKETPERFPVRFFLIAMIFIVVDIEIVFFYPWAVSHREVGWFGLGAILIFTVVVFESFVYLIANGALEWGPVKRVRQQSSLLRAEMRSAERTSTSTIRRVGLEGREELEPAEPHDDREPILVGHAVQAGHADDGASA